MILVDTSVWIDHLRSGDDLVGGLLRERQILGHAWVVGELAMGNLPERGATLQSLTDLPRATVAAPDEVLVLIEHQQLAGRGLGYVDVHLLASTLLTPGTRLWSRDRRLREVADELGVGFSGF